MPGQNERLSDEPIEPQERTPEEQAVLDQAQQQIEQLQFEGMEHGLVDGDVPPAPETGYNIPTPEDVEEQRTECITAFIVYVDAEGKAIATSKIIETMASIHMRREANVEDMRRACHEIIDDITTIITSNSTAKGVIENQMAAARQMQEQIQAAQLAAQIQQQGGLGGGKLLG